MRLFCCCTTALALVVLLVACTTVSPDQCWPNTSGGFGGSGTLPIAAGVGVTAGGLSPQEGPLDYSDPPNPCIEPASPCDGKCLADYEAAAAQCGYIANEAERRTCQDGAYAVYRSCEVKCAAAKTCQDMFDACQDIGGGCTKGFPGCSTFGLSPCAACFKNCNAGVSYPKACRCLSCGFK